MTGALFVLIVGTGATLRFWGLDAGLPSTDFRPDEKEIVQHTAGFLLGDFNTRWFVYPPAYLYLVWGWDEALLAVRRLWWPTLRYGRLLATDLPLLLLLGRALSAFAGTLTVILAYRAGREVAGRAAGLVAAALLATNWLHVRDSHALKTEALLAGAVLWATMQLGRWMAAPTTRRAIISGVAIGVATSCKYPGVFLLVAAWIVTSLASPPTGWRRWVPGRTWGIIFAATMTTFVALNPFLLLDWRRTFDWAVMLSVMLYASRTESQLADGAAAMTTAIHALATRAFGYHATVSLGLGAGLLVALATPVAIIVALRRRHDPIPFVAAVFTIVFYLVAGASPVHLARYFTPLVPLVLLLVAVALARRFAGRPWVLAGLTMVLLAQPLARAIAANRLVTTPDTRALATQWMAAHLPRGASVLVVGNHLLNVGTPPFPPGVRVANVPSGATGLAGHGVTHVVTQDHPLPFSTLDPTYMATLAPELEALATFSPWRQGPSGTFEREDAYYVPFAHFDGLVRPGPELHVYRVRS